MSQRELTISRTIPAAAKDIFQAWLDPKALRRFMVPGEGMGCPRAEIDPVVGGSFLIVMTAGDQELEHRGEYKEISEFNRIVFTWISGHTEPDSTVTIELKELGPKETELKLHHSGFPSDESRDNHQGGWTSIVETLAHTVS